MPANDVAHIIGGAGRSDEPCNLVALCGACHHEQHFIGTLNRGNLLFLKQLVDPSEFDHDRITVLAGKYIELEPVCKT